MPWADRQANFGAALLDPAVDAPDGLRGPDGKPCPKRFDVYRNNVMVGLVDVLEESFPAVRRLVGREFFRAMASDYVRLDPPKSPILLDYGAGFADFITAFEPAAGLPYLPDVARLERAWLAAYHAAEAEPIDAAAFAGINESALGEVKLRLHPSTQVVRSPYPAVTIWRVNLDDGLPPPLDLASGGEDALVLRSGAEVVVRSIPPGAAAFIDALGAGERVASAFSAAVQAAPNFDLAAALATLIPAGAFVGFGDGGEA